MTWFFLSRTILRLGWCRPVCIVAYSFDKLVFITIRLVWVIFLKEGCGLGSLVRVN